LGGRSRTAGDPVGNGAGPEETAGLSGDREEKLNA
jgi:hypothetical protein